MPSLSKVQTRKCLISTPDALRSHIAMLKAMRKPKCQRPAYWLTVPNLKKPNHPSIQKFIEHCFLFKHIGHEGLCIDRKLVNNEYIYSVYDGNNRINAILYFLKNPYKVFPSKYLNIDKTIDEDTVMKQTDKDALKKIIHDFDYKTLFNKCHDPLDLFGLKFHIGENGEVTGDELPFEEQHIAWQLYSKISEQKKRKLNLMLRQWKNSFGVDHDGNALNFYDVVILATFYEGYSPEELAEVFTTNKFKSQVMSDNDLYAAKLCYIMIKLTDTTMKYELLDIMKKYYLERDNDYELVEKYKVNESDRTLNAYDFIVSFTDYCALKYKLFNKFLDTKDKIHAFFVLFITLYQNKKEVTESGIDLNETHFTRNNVDDFIKVVKQACEILKDCVDNLCPASCKNIFNSSANKDLKFTTKRDLQVLMLSIIMKIKKDPDTDINKIKKKIKIILYYDIFYKQIEKKEVVKEKTLKPCHPFNRIRIGHWTEWMYDIKDNPDSLFNKVSNVNDEDGCNLTPNVFKLMLGTLLEKQSNVKEYVAKKKRRNLTVLDKYLMGMFYYIQMPTRELKQGSFSNEHIVPFSSRYDGEIDIDRLGNLVPTKDTINSKRKNKDLSIYYNDENFKNFSQYLTPILYSNEEYLRFVEYKKNEKNNKKYPYLLNAEIYNRICKQNEEEYINRFINIVFQ